MSERKINEGGPAFPLAFQELDGSGLPRTEMYAHDGMTMRDYFAAKAMAAHIAALSNVDMPSHKWHGLVAVAAYATADSMLRAREAGQ